MKSITVTIMMLCISIWNGAWFLATFYSMSAIYIQFDYDYYYHFYRPWPQCVYFIKISAYFLCFLNIIFCLFFFSFLWSFPKCIHIYKSQREKRPRQRTQQQQYSTRINRVAYYQCAMRHNISYNIMIIIYGIYFGIQFFVCLSASSKAMSSMGPFLFVCHYSDSHSAQTWSNIRECMKKRQGSVFSLIEPSRYGLSRKTNKFPFSIWPSCRFFSKICIFQCTILEKSECHRIWNG